MAFDYYNPAPYLPTTICICGSKYSLPVHGSCPAGFSTAGVLLSGGLLALQKCLLASGGINSQAAFKFCLSFLRCNHPSADGALGANVDHSANVAIADLPDGSAQLSTGENTVEYFAPDGSGGYSSAGNNTGAILMRSGKGTSADQFTLLSRDGTTSIFYGTYPSISTPGKIKSMADRWGNKLVFNWTAMGGYSRLASIVDSYGRTSNFTYDPMQAYRLTKIVDFDSRQVNFQYDSAGRLIAFVGPSVTRGANANANTFPNGTAYVFQYDVGNPRPERQYDLIKVWYPNQVAPYINSSRVVDTASVYASATPRRQISYFNDPTDAFHYGKVQQVIESATGSGSVGSGGYEERGNPIDTGLYFPPQNLGTTPSDADRSRYATTNYLDYQKDTTATVQADTALQAQLGLTSTQIGQLISYVSGQMSTNDGTGGLPAGFEMGIGDVNGEGTGSGTGSSARHQGSIVKIKYPAVRQLVQNPGGGDPWQWSNQSIFELFTSNAKGQYTTMTDAEGNLKVLVRYPENNPDGDYDVYNPGLSNKQYGRVKETHVDADPSTVMTLVGADGDMTTFIGNKITRTNTPGSYLNLTTTHQGAAGCTSCNYDPLGNILTTVDARGLLTKYDRNELGEVYRVTSPAPYSFQVETYYDANRNVTQIDTQDMVVLYTSTDPADPNYAKFTPTGSGTTANVPMTAGAGGAVRSGWFSDLFTFDLLDNKIEEDRDATGSTPASLVTTLAYDFNQNLIKIIKPLLNTIEFDYDERDLKFATRVGYDPAHGNPGAVTVLARDGNGNLTDAIGPAQRGTSSQSLSVIIDDAFHSGSALTHTGDWLAQNTYDGFDRNITGTNAVGGTKSNTFDPGGRAIAHQTNGTTGGPTPTDRTGSLNVPLSSASTRYDEAGRGYENQQNVFLNTGISGGSPTHALPSGRGATHTGGGLAANATTNNNTATVTLTTGGESYVLSRSVFDRASRLSASASDNGAIANFAYDGANRQLLGIDALNNQVQNGFDANGNPTSVTRVDKCTLSGTIATESFAALMLYDVMNQLVQRCDQGADGTISSSLSNTSALFNLIGRDSRGNVTNTIDPKQNTAIYMFDGASRKKQDNQHLRTGGIGTNAIVSTIVTKYTLDANSNQTTLVDNNGGTTNWTFDTLDRNTTLVFHDGSTRTWGFNLASDATSYTDENGSAFANTFDPMGQRTAVAITPATGVVGTTAQNFQFDGLSRLTWSEDLVGSVYATAPMIFDSIGRVIEEEPDYNGDIRYVTHDKWTSLVPTELTFPSGRQISMAQDPLYRLNSLTETTAGTNIANWQFFGQRTALVNLGNGLTCSFMNNAQTRSAIQSGQTTPGWGDKTTDQLGYDGAARPITKRFLPSGSTTSLVGFTTAYDKSSNKLFERPLHAELRAHLYGPCDSINRLLEEARGILASGGGSITTAMTLPNANSDRKYNLDGLGNWSTTTFTPTGGTAQTENRTHNKLNEITAFGVPPASTPVLYDQGNNTGTPPQKGNGNIIDDGTLLYAYDALNRQTTTTRKSDGKQVGAYVYDALGRRIRKQTLNNGVTGTVANATSRYLHDGNQIVEELDSTNSTLRQFIWGQYIDELIQLKTYASSGSQPLAAGVYYPLQDLLYRTTALTNSSAAVVEAYDFDAYGNTLIYSGTGTDGIWFTDDDVRTDQPACEFLFTGRQYDSGVQIYFYRMRYYDSYLGRPISRDLVTNAGAPNLYEYSGSRPSVLVDPSGMIPENIGPTDCQCFAQPPPPPIRCPHRFIKYWITWAIGVCVEAVCIGDCSWINVWHCEEAPGPFVPGVAWDWVVVLTIETNNCYEPLPLACGKQDWPVA